MPHVPGVQYVRKAWWGLRGYVVSAGGEKWEVHTFSIKKKETPQIIGLEGVWFKLRLFDSRFCTRPHVVLHSGPLHSLEVRKPAEKQPTCQLIWMDIGKWFPMITLRSTWRPSVSCRLQGIVHDRPGKDTGAKKYDYWIPKLSSFNFYFIKDCTMHLLMTPKTQL